MDYRLALLTGIDVPIPECQLIVHPPSLSDISFIGEQDFFVGIQCLCLYKSMFIEDKVDLSNVNNFQIFMTIMQEKQAQDQKNAVKKVLKLIFPNYTVSFTPNSILFVQDGTSLIVDQDNFEILQNVLRQIFCLKDGPMDQTAFNPKGDKAREIAQKLMRGRERIASEKGQSNTSIFTQYLSILSVGLQVPIATLTQYTMFQLYDQIERFMLKVNWDQDVAVRLAGGKSDNAPDNWMKNIH